MARPISGLKSNPEAGQVCWLEKNNRKTKPRSEAGMEAYGNRAAPPILWLPRKPIILLLDRVE